ncbi:C2 calcium-dependent domain-containing protein 4A isoform X2 [Choloepus didactylus]|uniref:C2 calcium-dependent domain-containing protein 4A isoform X2 n=1 Tax=Choloepus didactylus TaxID=27675 RepID=UPI0018A0E28D|nr:C2 calcium-dependent domain-containing protein 4A isoform X2 [Choloepus didactylus]
MCSIKSLCTPASGNAAVAPIACANVLTPDSIPDFCIPPRLAPGPASATIRSSWVEEVRADEGAARTDWDPRSQAALSLPHLPRARTAYGFCALLESPHTRRKESLFLGNPGAVAPLRPPAARPVPSLPTHTYSGGSRERGVHCVPQGVSRTLGGAFNATPVAPAGPRSPWDTLTSRPQSRRLLRASDRLLSRALRARRSRGSARARSVSSRDQDKERCACSGPPTPPSSESPPPPVPVPRPERLEAEGTVALGRAGGALRLAAEYCPGSGRLRIRLLCAEGLAWGAEGPRALGYRISFVLQSCGKTRKQRSAVVQRSRNPEFDQDFCFDGVSEEEVRCMAVRVKAKHKGRGLERDRELGQGELLLGSLLLL